MNYSELWALLYKFNRSIIKDYPNKLRCAICKELIIDARQGACGCIYCKGCIKSGQHCRGEGKYCKDTIVSMHEDFKTNKELAELMARCPNNECDFVDALSELPGHMRMCPKLPLTCPFRRVGCPENNVTNGNIDEHLLAEIRQHSSKMIDFLEKIEEKNKFLQTENEKTKKENSALEKILGIVNNNVSKQTGKIADLEKKLDEANRNIKQLCQIIEKLSKDFEVAKSDIQMITSSNKGFQDDVIKTFAGMEAQDKQKQISNRKMVEEQHGNIQKLKGEITKIENMKNVMDINLKTFQEHTWSISNDLMRLNYGDFVWIIDHFSDKRKLAQTGKNEEILSTPFYSEKNGYKLRLKCFINGLDNLKGKYVGISFYFVKGEFDDILPWPFMDIISLSIIDQESKEEYQRMEYGYYLTAEQDREVFNRPKSGNVGFGSMNFAKIDSLMINKRVLKNDTLFIRCCIHPAEQE